MTQANLFDAPVPSAPSQIASIPSSPIASGKVEDYRSAFSKGDAVDHAGRELRFHRAASGGFVWLVALDAGIAGPFYWVRADEVRPSQSQSVRIASQPEAPTRPETIKEEATPPPSRAPRMAQTEDRAAYFCPCPRVRSASRALQSIDPDDAAYGAYLAIMGKAMRERRRD